MMPRWLGCLLAAIIVVTASSAAVSKDHDPLPAGIASSLRTMPAPTTTPTGAEFGACNNGTDGSPVIYSEDRFLDEATRLSLIAYLDTATPTNKLDIVMVPCLHPRASSASSTPPSTA